MMKTMENSLLGMVRKFPGKALALILTMSLFSTGYADDLHDVFSPFAELLASDVNEGNVNYPAFAASAEFAEMMASLATTAPPRDADQKTRLAFYINAYNATSIQGILDGFSPSTIWGRLRFFKRRQYALFNTSLSLFELEHERIINEGDPRIHFAIVCSSKSCPPLRSELYTADGLDTELDAVTRAFVNNPDSNQFDADNRTARLSRIFKWYGDEFEAVGGGSLGAFLAAYVDDPDVATSLKNNSWKFSYSDYDWSLNGTPISSN
ncbi:MAG: DUF547 domain-containing protein [Pseudomonadota bacterium]